MLGGSDPAVESFHPLIVFATPSSLQMRCGRHLHEVAEVFNGGELW